MIMRRSRRPRNAAAMVELAVLLPFLMFLVLVVWDFGRAFYFAQTVDDCARAGAIYASDPYQATLSPYQNAEEAALAAAPAHLRDQLTVTSTSGSDADGNYVEVTVMYPFRTIANFPGIPDVDITRTVRVRVTAAFPESN